MSNLLRSLVDFSLIIHPVKLTDNTDFIKTRVPLISTFLPELLCYELLTTVNNTLLEKVARGHSTLPAGAQENSNKIPSNSSAFDALIIVDINRSTTKHCSLHAPTSPIVLWHH